MARIIPENAILFKENLYIVETELVLGGMAIIKWEIYTPEGYCFYNDTEAGNYDEEGNLRPQNEILHHQYMIMRKDEDLVRDHFIVVPLLPGYMVTDTDHNHEIA
jgi:hypothetical protein